MLISKSKIPSMDTFSGKGGLRSLMKQQSWRMIDLECSDPGIVIDLDFPEDYENAASGFKLTNIEDGMAFGFGAEPDTDIS